MAHDGQVVGDEQVGQAEPVLQVLQQVEHLGLDGHVEGRDGLVADDQLGVEGDGPGDADALALPAGELVGVAALVLGGEAYQRQQLRHPVTGVHPVDDERLAEDRADGLAGIEAGVGILEDDLHLPAQLPEPLGRRRR